MGDTISHRGPDDQGVWLDTEAGVALAHRRLSIIDLSQAGHQPMVSHSGRYVMVFNGEVYNHKALRSQLEKDGCGAVGCSEITWRGQSDTETLLACFEKWGIEKALGYAKGMFAIALWDRKLRQLVLARDRLGEKPLYYGWQGDAFLFASELKALRAHPAFSARIDRGALALFLRHNYVPGPYSIYEGIYKLPPGHLLRISPGQKEAEPARWWLLAKVSESGQVHPFQGTEDEATDALEHHLGNAVRSQMEADVPLGALLSGGLDSTAVVAMMQASSDRPVHTFTIGFGDKEYDEASHAKLVANHLGTEHVELRMDPEDALAIIPEIPRIYDEPFADSSQLPTSLVMRLTRQQVTVALSGDGGDEMLGGYNRYFLSQKIQRAVGWLPAAVRGAMGSALLSLPSAATVALLNPVARLANVRLDTNKLHKLGRRFQTMGSLDDFYVSLVTEWDSAERMVRDVSIPTNLLDKREDWPALNHPISRMMAMDALTYLPDDILVKVDRAAMAASLETRAPFLDRDLVEFAWRLPMDLKIRNGKGKWLLRRLVDRYVPTQIMDRPKAGFGIPLDEWLRGPLREWTENQLSEERMRREGYIDPGPVRTAWKQHLLGASNGYRLWSVLMFQSWLEKEQDAMY